MDISYLKEGDATATVFLPKMSIDKGTMDQIREMMIHPTIKDAKFMPDCHRGGKGCCIGTTAPLLKNIVAPRLVGGDIGCGITSHPIVIGENFTMEKIDEIVRTEIKMGSGFDSIFKEAVVGKDVIDNICKDALYDANEFCYAFKNVFGVDIFPHRPMYNYEWFVGLCKKIDMEPDYAMRSIGTLGGGNHYVEINKSENGKCYLTIHSGSRALGDKICSHHQAKIDETRRFNYDEFRLLKKKSNRKTKVSKELKSILDDYRDNFEEERHPDYLEEDEAYEYYFDMIFAQKFAQWNRRTMITRVMDRLGLDYDEDAVVESIHNYIDFKDFIIRKGAISAYDDKLCIISLNMKDGILLCRGKSNPDWNWSAAHGAGRLLTRDAARSKVSLKEFKESMEGIYSTSVCTETIDESPFSYKDSETIKKYLVPTVEIIEQLRPIYNAKALT